MYIGGTPGAYIIQRNGKFLLGGKQVLSGRQVKRMIDQGQRAEAKYSLRRLEQAREERYKQGKFIKGEEAIKKQYELQKHSEKEARETAQELISKQQIKQQEQQTKQQQLYQQRTSMWKRTGGYPAGSVAAMDFTRKSPQEKTQHFIRQTVPQPFLQPKEKVGFFKQAISRADVYTRKGIEKVAAFGTDVKFKTSTPKQIYGESKLVYHVAKKGKEVTGKLFGRMDKLPSFFLVPRSQEEAYVWGTEYTQKPFSKLILPNLVGYGVGKAVGFVTTPLISKAAMIAPKLTKIGCVGLGADYVVSTAHASAKAETYQQRASLFSTRVLPIGHFTRGTLAGQKAYSDFSKKITKARIIESGKTEILRGAKLKKGQLIEETGIQAKVEVHKELLGKKWGKKIYDVGVTSQKTLELGDPNYVYKNLVLVKGKEGLSTFVGTGKGKINMKQIAKVLKTQEIMLGTTKPTEIRRTYRVGGKEEGILTQIGKFKGTKPLKFQKTELGTKKLFGGELFETHYPQYEIKYIGGKASIKTIGIKGKAKTDYIISPRQYSPEIKGSTGETKAITKYDILGTKSARIETGTGKIKGIKYPQQVPAQKVFQSYDPKTNEWNLITKDIISKRPSSLSTGIIETRLIAQPRLSVPKGVIPKPAPTLLSGGQESARLTYLGNQPKQTFRLIPILLPSSKETQISKPSFEIISKSIQKPISKQIIMPEIKFIHKPISKITQKTSQKIIQKPILKLIQKPAQKIIQKPIQKPIEKIIEKPILKLTPSPPPPPETPLPPPTFPPLFTLPSRKKPLGIGLGLSPKPRKRGIDVEPLSDLLSVNITEMFTKGKKATHPRSTPKEKYLFDLGIKKGQQRFPTMEMRTGKVPRSFSMFGETKRKHKKSRKKGEWIFDLLWGE